MTADAQDKALYRLGVIIAVIAVAITGTIFAGLAYIVWRLI